MDKRVLAVAIAVAGLLLLVASSAYTQGSPFPRLASPDSTTVPHLINYQGRLTDVYGNPVSDGDYDMRFCIYDVASGGTALWCEPPAPDTWQSVPVNQGVFSVLLGETHPIPSTVFDGASSDRWLGVQIRPDEQEMDPRRRIVSVGYAYRAESANTGGNGIPSGMVVYAGHADIDLNVSEKVYIHPGAAPTSVKLYLWGEKFSPLFYTELGQHSHGPGDIYIPHEHAVRANTNSETGRSVNLENNLGAWGVYRITDSGGPAGTPTGNTDPAGVPGGPLSTSVKDWLDHMKVWIDGVDRTADVLDRTPLTEFGDGTEGHDFNTETGSGEMDITSLITGTGQHVIEFKVASGGGRVRYNLYVNAGGIGMPSGMIGMFDTDCPPGWTRVAELDDRFPMGGTTYGATGGSSTHTHTGVTDGQSGMRSDEFSMHDIPRLTGNHTHSFTTDPASSLPPYITVVFCRKD